jgi:DNA polymerase-1
MKYIITDPKDLGMIDKNLIALDLETTGLDPHKDSILGIAIADINNEYYIDPSLMNYMEEFKTVPKILHNFKFDYRFFYIAGIDFRNTPTEDTLVMSHLYDENMSHSLDDVASVIFQKDYSYKKEFWKKYKKAELAPVTELHEYAMADVRLTYDLCNSLLGMFDPIAYKHVMRLSMALLDTEVEGLKIDIPYVIEMGTKLKERIQRRTVDMHLVTENERHIWEMQEWVKELDKRKSPRGKANVKRPEFSFDSNKQLGELLYDILELPEQKSKEKRRTVDDAALTRLEHPVIEPLRDYREANKIYGTYIEGILERVAGEYIYPTFNTCGTVTGRISHQNPNMGNMPRDGGLRGMFIPNDGYSFITADYAQLEICMAAHFSKDTILIDAILKGISMHDITAQALNIDRQKAKTLNFGILYGASKWKVKEIFKCEEKEAEEIIKKFFVTYPGLNHVIKSCHEAVEDGLPITNPFGRSRSFFGQWNNRRELERCKRQAFNALLQGTGGDITSRAFYLIHDYLKANKIGRALFTVHDEIIIEVRSEDAPKAAEMLEYYMLEVGKELKLEVPLAVDVSDPLTRWEK